MLSRRQLALALASAAFAPGLAVGQEPEPEPTSIIGAGEDRYDRLTIPVRVGGQGPYDFVVDTGADRSVLSQDIADSLGLEPGKPVIVQGIVGAELTQTVKAPELDLGRIVLKGLDMPVLPRERLGADGLLGVDALQRRRLIMDFRERRLEIQAASGAFYPNSTRTDAFVPVRDRFGRLVIIDANANRVPVAAFIDSGAGMSIGNRALADAIRARGDWRDSAPLAPLYGVTSHEATGEVRRLDFVRLGGVRFTDIPVLIADLDLFEQWGVANRPTLLLGVDVLRLFSRVEMDYGRKRVMFRVGADPQIWLA
ncbi:MAG: retroviral-like aspartic protease family protein [Caulobacter sp.]|nr:retroviral-like aspartic protease family protein [Caulobacter sp.]